MSWRRPRLLCGALEVMADWLACRCLALKSRPHYDVQRQVGCSLEGCCGVGAGTIGTYAVRLSVTGQRGRRLELMAFNSTNLVASVDDGRAAAWLIATSSLSNARAWRISLHHICVDRQHTLGPIQRRAGSMGWCGELSVDKLNVATGEVFCAGDYER